MNVRLVVVQGKPAGKALLFGPGRYYLGRGPECHIRFNSDWVSRQHCELVVGPGPAVLRDLSSRNGTLVNGGVVDGDRTLAAGDKVQVGPVTFEVKYEISAQGIAPAADLFHGSDSNNDMPGIESTAHHLSPPE